MCSRTRRSTHAARSSLNCSPAGTPHSRGNGHIRRSAAYSTPLTAHAPYDDQTAAHATAAHATLARGAQPQTAPQPHEQTHAQDQPTPNYRDLPSPRPHTPLGMQPDEPAPAATATSPSQR